MGTRVGLGERLFARSDRASRRCRPHQRRTEDTAVPVVGELVEAEVGLHDESVADLGDRVGDRQVEDPGRVRGLRADGVPDGRDGEEHHAAQPGARSLRDRLAQRVAGVLGPRPASRRIGWGSVSPSFTNTGSTSCDGVAGGSQPSGAASLGSRAAGAGGSDGSLRAPRGWGSVRASRCSAALASASTRPDIVCSVATPASGTPEAGGLGGRRRADAHEQGARRRGTESGVNRCKRKAGIVRVFLVGSGICYRRFIYINIDADIAAEAIGGIRNGSSICGALRRRCKRVINIGIG